MCCSLTNVQFLWFRVVTKRRVPEGAGDGSNSLAENSTERKHGVRKAPNLLNTSCAKRFVCQGHGLALQFVLQGQVLDTRLEGVAHGFFHHELQLIPNFALCRRRTHGENLQPFLVCIDGGVPNRAGCQEVLEATPKP